MRTRWGSRNIAGKSPDVWLGPRRKGGLVLSRPFDTPSNLKVNAMKGYSRVYTPIISSGLYTDHISTSYGVAAVGIWARGFRHFHCGSFLVTVHHPSALEKTKKSSESRYTEQFCTLPFKSMYLQEIRLR